MAALYYWTGTAWEPISTGDGGGGGGIGPVGPVGPPGPSAVSTNAGQLAKLGTDNLILVSSADLDTRYVNVVGDTMTGTLTVRAPAGSSSFIQVLSEGNVCACSYDAYGTAAAFPFLSFKKFRGTAAAPTAALNGDSLSVTQVVTANAAGTQFIASQIRTIATADAVVGQAGLKTRMEFSVHSGTAAVVPFQITDAGSLVTSTGSDPAVTRVALTANTQGASKVGVGIGIDVTGGTAQNIGLQIGNMTGAVSPYAILSYTTAPSLFNGGMSVGAFTTLTATRRLDVTGDAIVRGVLETTGNITSTGTAHSFVASSIPAPAVAPRLPIIPTSNYTFQLADAGGTALNTTLLPSLTLTIPNDTAVAFPIGTRFEVLDASPTSQTVIQAGAGVTLQWNSNLTAVGSGTSGSVGAGVTLPGPFARCLLYKIASNSWVVIS
jgi:hypothetical protein